jgi:hypothetical protein
MGCFFKLHNIDFIYEPQKFVFTDVTINLGPIKHEWGLTRTLRRLAYIPDFYFPLYDSFMECKSRKGVYRRLTHEEQLKPAALAFYEKTPVHVVSDTPKFNSVHSFIWYPLSDFSNQWPIHHRHPLARPRLIDSAGFIDLVTDLHWRDYSLNRKQYIQSVLPLEV